ncbi:hypothetical protein [Paraburkholderia sp.]|jgi:hypothetical protein|uniref:hypothetical protein n=1 Tax=Paraburkholderia sp. TaxID=1926495 RepID=UPI002F415321
MSIEHPSKDQFFERVGALADEMIAAYGKDFSIGVLVLAARFVAEGKAHGEAELAAASQYRTGP